jgi:putative restriction endonuclease
MLNDFGDIENKREYSQYMGSQNRDGSNKASSYIRALELLGPILANRSTPFAQCADVFSIQSIEYVDDLYRYILEQQNLGEAGIFDTKFKPSYWRKRFFSAALKSYKEFLVLKQYKDKLWATYNEPNVDPKELGKRLSQKRFEAAIELVPQEAFDYSSKEGKDALRQIKMRVNQDFFRDMILCDYRTQCCVTGLNVAGVLRASHIVGWADDPQNRMNPANGLCLSATYDAAFDHHLISFDDDFRMIFSRSLKDFYTNQAFKTQFLAFEGKPISLPKRFHPDKDLLQLHRQKLV